MKKHTMKKTIYLLFALCALSMVSCNHSVSNKGTEAKMAENLMAKENKENKSLVKEKKYTSEKEHWEVSLTSKLKDTRTIDEMLNNVPRKEDIVNTVVFETFHLANFNAKDNPFPSSIDVRKKIKYNSDAITFDLKVSINTKPNVKASSTAPLQIKLSAGNSLNIDTDEIIYKRNEKIFKAFHVETHDIIATSKLSIKEINLLRSQQDGFTVFLNTTEGVFKLKCPQIFIEYLKEF